jgi:prepilin-type N-terminal cleavage/methylation domain-containing protein
MKRSGVFFGQVRSIRRKTAAFSLVEIMVVVTIISMLAAMGVPALKNVQRRTVATAIGNDLRAFAAAFDVYAHETGDWPAEAAEGVFPTEMANRIKSTDWLRTTPLGGQYNWDNNQTHAGTRYRAAIAISSTASAPFVPDVDLLEAIDSVIDDGNLATGNFRIGADDEPVFIIAP